MPTTPNRKRKAPNAEKTKKRVRKKLPLPVYVVDEHNDAMLPFYDALKSKKLPRSGVKMLHYDSHPDLGNPTKPTKYMKQLAKGKENKTEIHKITDIATWITPLVQGGFVDEVIWVAGSWCKQIDEGSYELVCGLDKKSGLLKTASADGNNEDNEAVSDYWDCDGTAGELDDLEFKKPWILHVFKHNKAGKLPDDSFYEIADILKDSPWVLDIDEDFFSCNNPHRDDFSACFGEKSFKLVKKIYDIGDPWTSNLENIIQEKLFLKPEGQYLKRKDVKAVIKQLKEENLDGIDLMKKFRLLLAEYYEEEYPEGVNVEQLFDLKDFHTAGMYSSLPHHLTKVNTIVEMGNAVEEILNELMTNKPVHVTLATSRADRYLPDCQAAIIHDMLDNMMEALYEDVNVVRMDKPEFSINFGPPSDSDEES